MAALQGFSMNSLLSPYSTGLLLPLWPEFRAPCPSVLEFNIGLPSLLDHDLEESVAGSQDGGISLHGASLLVNIILLKPNMRTADELIRLRWHPSFLISVLGCMAFIIQTMFPRSGTSS